MSYSSVPVGMKLWAYQWGWCPTGTMTVKGGLRTRCFESGGRIG